MTVPGDVLIAAAIAIPEIVNLSRSVIAPLPAVRIDQTLAGRLFRWLDARLAGRMQQLCWIAVDFLLVRAVVWAWQSQLTSIALTVTLGAIVLAAFAGFPFMVAYSCCIAPLCERRPIHLDRDRHFPGHQALESAWREIRNEFHAVAAQATLPQMVDVLRDNGLPRSTRTPGADARWNVLILRVAGRNLSPNIDAFPTLGPLLDRPEIVNALFSILPPGVALCPHRGYYKGVLRYHLGLEVPEPDRTRLTVDGTHYQWSEGEGVLFDDMYLHAAENHGTKTRVVLFLDINRKLPGKIGDLNRFVTWIAGKHPYIGLLERRAAWMPPSA